MRIVQGTSRNDIFRATDEEEFFTGGAGFDTVDYSSSPTRIIVRLEEDNAASVQLGSGGFSRGDVLVGIEQVIGTRSNDIIDGNSEDNTLQGRDGDDRLNGGGGRDTLMGGDHNDTIRGGSGDDLLIGGTGSDYLDGDGGIDTVSFADLNDGVGVLVRLDRSFATHGNEIDTIGEIENVIGTATDDTIYGNDVANVLTGGGGRDTIEGFGNDDKLDGGAGNDMLYGDEGRDTLIGGLDDDSLFGGADDDTLLGGTGNDTIFGGMGADRIDGEAGFDVLSYADSNAAVLIDLAHGIGRGGTAEGDVIKNVESVFGSSRGDGLLGSDRGETLDGNSGSDTINGRGGIDTLIGGHGDDVLTGGEGADTFVFHFHSPVLEGVDFGNDTVTDFELGLDHVQIGGQIGGATLQLEQVGHDTLMTRAGFDETVTFLDTDAGALKQALAVDGYLF